MTIEDAIKMLKAKLECMTRDTSGSDDDCNHKRCDQCHLNYEKGTMGEQKECLKTVIKALEQEPCEDAISRQAVLELAEWFDLNQQHFTVANLIDEVENMPSVQPKVNVLDKIKAEIADLDDTDYDFEGYYKAVTDVLQIIDKYKESEEK